MKTALKVLLGLVIGIPVGCTILAWLFGINATMILCALFSIF